eukprot:6468300-Amphidinium_carterae.6
MPARFIVFLVTSEVVHTLRRCEENCFFWKSTDACLQNSTHTHTRTQELVNERVPSSMRRQQDGWRQKHLEVKQKLGLLDCEIPAWTDHKKLGLVQDLDRLRDCINTCYAVHHQKETKAGKTPTDGVLFPFNQVLDLSQGLDRSPWSTNVRSICGGSNLYIFQQQRCLRPSEHLELLGWPAELATRKTEKLKHAQVRDLAGESMALPCVALANLALIAVLPDPTLWSEGVTL